MLFQISDSNRNPICILCGCYVFEFFKNKGCHFILKLIFLKVFLVHISSPPKGNERWEGKNSIMHCFNGKKQRNYFCVMSILTVIWYFICLDYYCKFWFYIRSRSFVQLQQWVDCGRFLIFDVVYTQTYCKWKIYSKAMEIDISKSKK